MRQALVYILFISMVATVFIFLGINLLFFEQLTEMLSFRFFVDVSFVAVSCFFLPGILFLESELKPKQCAFFVLATVAYTLLSLYAYSINFDTALALMLCLIFNVVLLGIFAGIHIKRRHPIIVELEALEMQAAAAVCERLQAGVGYAELPEAAAAIDEIPITVDRLD